MKIIKATSSLMFEKWKKSNVTLFLGGSIEMGLAENWQSRIENELSDYDDLIILNPRRDDWDSSWVQDPTPGTQFHEQVSWELAAQEDSDLLIYNFSAGTKSPITLLEFGLFLSKKPFVICPKDFWRYGNVKVVCDTYGIDLYETIDEVLPYIKQEIEFILDEKTY